MSVDRSWLRTQIDRYAAVRPAQVALADRLRAQLAGAVDAAGVSGAIVQARAKTLDAFAEKALRKADKYRDPATQLTDLCGVRVITHTPAQAARVCELVIRDFAIDWSNSQDVSARLETREFGYASVHYVARVDGMAVEIQVRTLLQHVWAEIAHDRLYKSDLDVPARWQRPFARLAAVLEDADHSLERLAAMIDEHRGERAAYLTREERARELEALEALLELEPGRADVLLRLARLAGADGQWDRIVTALDGPTKPRPPALERELGRALCRRGGVESVARGRTLLAKALADDPRDPAAAALLAASLRGEDDERAGELYRRAFELDPQDPYLLVALLEHELRHERLPSLALLGPSIHAALARCQVHADLGMHLPFAYFASARLHMLAGRGAESIAAWARAVAACLGDGGKQTHVLDGELGFLERMAARRDALPAWGVAQRLLLCARCLAEPEGAPWAMLAAMASARAPVGPVVAIEADGPAAPLVREALAGVRAQPAGSVDELIQLWIDALVARVSPSAVRVVVAGGGVTLRQMCCITAALGGHAGVIQGGGGECERLLAEVDWAGVRGLHALPADAHVLRAFVAGETRLPGATRETLARAIHERYRGQRSAEIAAGEPSLAEWAQLDASLQESNRAQADDIAAKLAAIGCTLAPLPPGAPPAPLTEAEIEVLARIEHGRWTAERLRAGWRLGEKDVARRRSPYLVSWDELSEAIRDYDRQAVRQIPELLAQVGLMAARA